MLTSDANERIVVETLTRTTQAVGSELTPTPGDTLYAAVVALDTTTRLAYGKEWPDATHWVGIPGDYDFAFGKVQFAWGDKLLRPLAGSLAKARGTTTVLCKDITNYGRP